MENENRAFNDLIDYYIDQIYKMLGLFEDKNKHSFKFGVKILSELEQIPYYYPHLESDYRFKIVLLKVSRIVEELFFLDGEHQFIKNHVMESLKLLEEIKEG